VVLDVTFTSDEKGKPQVITGFGRDVTECKQVEVALHESERRYRELVKHAPVGIFEVDFRHKRLLSANDYMCQMSGYSREELLAMNPMDILDEQSKITFQARIKQWLNGEKPDHKVDYKVKAKDGRDIYAVFDVTCTKDEKGKLLGATVIGQDITKRKLAEIELNQCKIELELKVEERTKELIESNQKMTDILSSITDGFCVFDSELTLYLCKPGSRDDHRPIRGSYDRQDFRRVSKCHPNYVREVSPGPERKSPVELRISLAANPAMGRCERLSRS